MKTFAQRLIGCLRVSSDIRLKMQLRILILASTLALAVGKPYGNKGGYDRDSDPLLVQSHVPVHQGNAEHIRADQGIKTAQPAQAVRPHTGSVNSAEHVSVPENRVGSGRYSSRTQDVSANRPFQGGHSVDDTQRPIGGGYGVNYQRPIGGGHGESYQSPISRGHGESYQRPIGGGYGESYQRPIGEGYGEHYQRPIGGGYGESVRRPNTAGYVENTHRPTSELYSESVQRPIRGGYEESYQRPIRGGYEESFPRPIRGGYVGNSHSSPISGGYRQVPRSNGFGHNSNHEVETLNGGSVLINRPQTVGVKGGHQRQVEHVGY